MVKAVRSHKALWGGLGAGRSHVSEVLNAGHPDRMKTLSLSNKKKKEP